MNTMHEEMKDDRVRFWQGWKGYLRFSLLFLWGLLTPALIFYAFIWIIGLIF